MIVRKQHIITGKWNELKLDVTEEQLERHKNGEKVQDVFPHLTADEREFLISGILPGEFDELFPPEDGDENEFPYNHPAF